MLDRRIFKFNGARSVLIKLAALAVLQALCIILQGRWLSVSLTHLWEKHPLASVLGTLACFFLAFTGRQLIQVAKNLVLQPFADATTATLQRQLITAYTQGGPSMIQTQGTGKTISLTIDGVNQVHQYLLLVLVKFMDMMIIPWIILAYLATLQWKEALFLFAVYPVIVLFMIILGYTAQAKADREYDRFNRLSNHFIDTLRGLKTLKQVGLSKKYANSIYKVSEDYRKATLSTLTVGTLSTYALDFFTTLSIAVIALFLGLGLMDGVMTLLPALTMLVLAPDYFLPIRNFANDYHATLDGKNALQDMLALINAPRPDDQDQYHAPAHHWAPNSTLQLTDGAFQYPDGLAPALQEIDLNLKGYQKVAIIGASGSGKSTLLNVLGGSLVGTGVAALNGQTVPHFAQTDWQQSLQMMPQDPYLFHASLRDNLTFYAPDVSDDAIWQALTQVSLRDWAEQLPAGLDTVIGDGAFQSSGGQAQRISLARIILDQARRVILLDEPTAHLDIETELDLKADMLPVFADRLVLLATHRLHWLAQMDWIVVMEAGGIVEQGTLATLQAKNGAFVRLQAAMQGGTQV